jgi:hypothetical protein
MRAARFRLLAGLALIGLILFGQTLLGAATASWRLDPALRDPTGPVNVVVVMDFTPERFHTERLSAYGVFAGRDKAVNRVRLRMVSPENLRRLSGLIWVSSIEPAK